MKKILDYTLIVVLFVSLLTYAAVSIPSLSLPSLLFGPSDREMGIKNYKIDSLYQNHQNIVDVLLPDNFDRNHRYRVLYILPPNVGLWDGLIINGIREAGRQDVHNRFNVICVYPHFERMPWYGDHPTDPSIRQESHLLYAIIPFIDRHFPTIPTPSGRYLIGYSKSGWAAFVLLLRNPHLFDKAASFDAPLLFDDIHQWGTGLEEIFGDEDNFLSYSLPHLLRMSRPAMQNRSPRFVLMGYALIKDQTVAMHDLMNRLGVPHVYDLKKWKSHSWEGGWFPIAAEYLLEGKKK